MANQKSIGIVEYRSVALGIKGADAMLKSAQVDLIFARTVCPGKYIVLISGSLSAVTASVEAGKQEPYASVLVDDLILGNPHESIFDGIYGSCEVTTMEAMGILETYSVCSIMGSADTIVKTTPVQIVEIRIANGMSGRSFAIFSGEISAVQASMDKAEKDVKDSGMFLNSAVIARPDERLWKELV